MRVVDLPSSQYTPSFTVVLSSMRCILVSAANSVSTLSHSMVPWKR